MRNASWVGDQPGLDSPHMVLESVEDDEEEDGVNDDLDDLLMDMVMGVDPKKAKKPKKGKGLAGPQAAIIGATSETRLLSTETHYSSVEVLGQGKRQSNIGVLTATKDRPAASKGAQDNDPSPSRQVLPDDLEGPVRLAVQAYIAFNIAPACGQVPESLGPSHVYKAFSGQLFDGVMGEELKWFKNNEPVMKLALKAFRAAVKITLDSVVMGEDAAELPFADLEAALRELDEQWHLGTEDDASWKGAMERRVPNLMALRKKGVSEVHVLRLCLKEDGVRVGELRPEVVQSIWASASVELRYCTNDDDERYSIQAHPTLLRNMIVQSSEYPIFISPPTTVWL